jgi:hypothetical protein
MPWELTGNSGTTSTNFLGTTDAQPLSIRTNNSEKARLTPSGELLIGTATSSPGAKLRVAGGGATINNVVIGTHAPGINYPEQDRTIGVTNTSATLRLQSPNGVALHAGPSGATPEANQALTVTVAGDVGIGTVAPAHKLDVAGTLKATSINTGTLDATDVRKNGTSLVSSQWADGAGGISYSGNVGIGKSAGASYRLDTAGPINATDFHRNGSPLVGSQWSGTAGSITYGGNVSIGTPSTTAAKLSVSGGGATINSIAIGTDVSGVPGINYPNKAETIGVATPSATLRLQSPSGLTLHTGPTGTTPEANQRVIVTAAGDVGIGTATPGAGYKLDVAGVLNATDVRKNGASLVSSQWAGVAGGISYGAGNVGIGMVPQAAKLSIATATTGGILVDSAATNNVALTLRSSGTGWGSGLQLLNTTATTGRNYGLYAGSDGTFHIADTTTGADRLLINNAGNVGIGKAPTSTYKLDVAGTINATDIYRNGSSLVSSQWTAASGGISYGGGSVGVGKAPSTTYRLDAAGTVNASDYRRDGRRLIAAGRTQPGAGWKQYINTGVYIDVDTAGYHFTTTPVYVTSLHGREAHWGTTGGSSVYIPTPTGFRVYIRWWNNNPMTVSQVQNAGWYIEWIGTEID